MKKFFSKLGQTGANIGVIVISIVVFLVAFFVVNGIANSQKPDTVEILAAARDLGVGETIAPQDLVVKTVFVDDNASMYIAADEEGIASVANGTIVVPVFVGQPILRTSVVARAGESNRLSALLANYPEGGSLFPLPLDFANVVSPDIDTFLPGDLVSVTVVISSRPQPPVTPTVMPEFITGDSPYIGIAPQVVATPIPLDTELDKSKALLHPPLSKDLFPAGIRVVEVQGGTELMDTSADTGDTVDPAAGYIDFNKPKTLIILVPDNKREELALALQEGDMLVISLLSRGSEASTEGFSYWDFEEWLKNEREEAYKDSLSSPTPQTLPSPTFTPTPITEGN